MDRPFPHPMEAPLEAARRIVDDTAWATIGNRKKPPKKLAHIDAARWLMTAAEELFWAAEYIASGKPIAGHGASLRDHRIDLARGLRVAEGQLLRVQRALNEAEERQAKAAEQGVGEF